MTSIDKFQRHWNEHYLKYISNVLVKVLFGLDSQPNEVFFDGVQMNPILGCGLPGTVQRLDTVWVASTKLGVLFFIMLMSCAPAELACEVI